MERTDEILAGIGVDPRLSADCGVDHAEQCGGHMHDVDPTQPGRGHETGDIGSRPAAEADDRILTTNTDAAQHFPDEPDDGQVLTFFGVGYFDAMCVDALVRQGVPDGLGGLRQHWLMQDRHLVPAGQCALQLAEQSGTDDHRVRRIDEDFNGYRLSHGWPSGCGLPRSPAMGAPRWSVQA